MKARTAERECQSRGGHLASIHSQDENRTIKEMVGSGSMAWIGLKRRTVRNRPWVWTDDTELDFREWKPDVTDDENCFHQRRQWLVEGEDERPEAPFRVQSNRQLPTENR